MCDGQDDGWDNDDDVGTVGTLTTTEAGEISEDDDDEDEDYVPCYEDEADIAREDATHEACMQQCFEKNRQKHGDGEPEMGAVDDAEDDDAPHFHFLKKAGIEAADSGKIRAVLAECWRALSINISDGNNKKKPRTTEFIHHNTSTKGTLLLVPETKYDDPIAGDNRFQRRTKDEGTIEALLVAATGGKAEHVEHAARSYASYFARRRHKDAFYDAAAERNMTIVAKPMSKYETAAMVEDTNMNLTTLRIVSRYVKEHLGGRVFATEKEMEELGQGFAPAVFGRYEHKATGKAVETIDHWHKPVDEAIRHDAEQFFLHAENGSGREWNDLKKIGIVAGADHGKGAFRVALQVGYFFKDGKPPVRREIRVGHMLCKHENDEILSNTVMVPIGESLKKMEGKGLEIRGLRRSNATVPASWKEIGANQHQPLKEVKQFGAGDLAFQFIAQGRVGNNFWCVCCDLHPTAWKEQGHCCGRKWTHRLMDPYVQEWKNDEYKGREANALSIRKSGYWTTIEMSDDANCWGHPNLHMFLGQVNDVIGPEGYFFKIIEDKIVKISAKEKSERAEHASIDALIAAAKTERDNWIAENKAEQSSDRRTLKAKEHSLAVLSNPNLTPTDAQNQAKVVLKADIKDLQDKVKAAEQTREAKAKNIERLEKQKKSPKTKLANYQRARNIKDGGIHQVIEKTLHKYEIKRGAYHGGTFQGPDCRRATKNAEKLFDDLYPILVEHNREEDGMTDDDIKELCKACSNLLHTLDATHSRFLKWYMKWDDEAKKAVRELEALIASALKQARAIGISITPKWHLLEDHILDQHIWLVKNGWGGICWLDESFVERAHQEGVKEDRRTQGVKGHEAQQTAQFKAEERASNPKVEERRERNSRVARTRKRTRTEAVKAETDDKRQQMIMMATDGDEDVEMGAGHV